MIGGARGARATSHVSDPHEAGQNVQGRGFCEGGMGKAEDLKRI